MRRSNWLAIATAAALLAGGSIISNGRAESSSPRGQWRTAALQQVKEKLALTDEQVSEIRAVVGGERERITDLLKRLHQARKGLREAIHGAEFDESAVRAAAAKVAAVEADTAVERAKLYARIRLILTAEQLEKIAHFKERADDFVDEAIRRLGERLAE